MIDMKTDQNSPENAEDWRALSPQEVAVMGHLLAADFLGRDELAAQARVALVRRIDREGSLSFQVDGPPAKVRGRVAVEGRYHDDGAEPAVGRPAINLLLHVIEGRLHELEVYKDDGSDIAIGPFEVPFALIEVHQN